MSVFNWDTIIAQYNFSHYKSAFVHLDFLAKLSDKTLPYLDKSQQQLEEIVQLQQKQFHFEEKFLSSSEYYRIIQLRKKVFEEEWEKTNWLEWNLADQRAYNQLQIE